MAKFSDLGLGHHLEKSFKKKATQQRL